MLHLEIKLWFAYYPVLMMHLQTEILFYRIAYFEVKISWLKLFISLLIEKHFWELKIIGNFMAHSTSTFWQMTPSLACREKRCSSNCTLNNFKYLYTHTHTRLLMGTHTTQTGMFFFSNRLYNTCSLLPESDIQQEKFYTVLALKSSSTSFSLTQKDSDIEKAENAWWRGNTCQETRFIK